MFILTSFIAWALSKALRFTSSGLLKRVLGVLAAADDNAAKVAIAEIQAEIATRQAAKEIRLATAGFPEMRIATFAIALPFIIHLWAVSLDTIFKLGWKVFAFPEPFASAEINILLSFFGVQLAGKAITTIGGVFYKRGK